MEFTSLRLPRRYAESWTSAAGGGGNSKARLFHNVLFVMRHYMGDCSIECPVLKSTTGILWKILCFEQLSKQCKRAKKLTAALWWNCWSTATLSTPQSLRT
eukprot:4825615-Lingulodinium_polyedra.AAC.1